MMAGSCAKWSNPGAGRSPCGKAIANEHFLCCCRHMESIFSKNVTKRETATTDKMMAAEIV